MSSSLAARAVLRSRSSVTSHRGVATKCIRRNLTRRFATSSNAAAASASSKQEESTNISPAVLVSAIVAGAIALKGSKEESSCDTARSASRTPFSLPSLAHAEPRRSMTMQQPRNVMLHRMRSGAGRSLNDKYKVDWKTVLGEGAYGSVHPARLAATGEKVRS